MNSPNNPITSKPIFSYIVLILLAISIFLLAVFKIYDPDIWFHLASGKYILQTKHVLTKDIFSYAKEGQPWLNPSWLTQIIFYAIYRLAGYSGLILFKAAIITSAFLIVFFSMHKRGSEFPISVLVILLAVAVSRDRFTERPHVLSFIFLATYSYLLYSFSRRENEFSPSVTFGRYSKSIWLILPLQLAWVNLHSESLLGITLVSIYLSSAIIEFAYLKALKKEADRRYKFERIKILFAMLLGVCIFSAINPNGWRSIFYGFFTLREDTFRTYVVEFRSTNLFREAFSFQLFFYIGLVSFLLNRYRRLEDIIAFSVFFYLAIDVVRFKPNFVVVTAPAIAENLSRSLGLFFEREESEAWRRDLRQKFAYSITAAIVLWFTVYQLIPKGEWMVFGLGVNEYAFSKRAVEFIKDNDLQGNMFNPMGFGGYLIWHLYPEKRVLIDGRTDIYGTDLLYKVTNFKEPHIWNELMDKHDFNYVLTWNVDIQRLYPCENLDRQKEAWALVYWDDACLIYLRRNEKNKTLLEKYEYKYLLPNNPDFSYLDAYLKNPLDRENVTKELERNLESNPQCLLTHTCLAYIYTQESEDQKAIEHLKKAIAIVPYRAELYSHLGMIYQKKGLYDEAIKEYKKALRKDSRFIPAYLNLGTVYFLKGEHRKALYQFRKALKFDPENEGIQNNARLALEALVRSKPR